eukprot:15353546-Ditylum_brightwellii.AAC.1
MRRDGNELNTGNEHLKQQGGSLLPFLDHDFKDDHTTEWYQWELNAQLLAKGTTQLNVANNMGTRAKALIIKLLAVHDKDNINIFAETKQCLEVEKFPKCAKEVKDLLAYGTTNGCYNNVSMILHATGLILFEQLNEALAAVASELDKEDKMYFKNYGTSRELANFE